jgi:hypothetical protein
LIAHSNRNCLNKHSKATKIVFVVTYFFLLMVTPRFCRPVLSHLSLFIALCLFSCPDPLSHLRVAIMTDRAARYNKRRAAVDASLPKKRATIRPGKPSTIATTTTTTINPPDEPFLQSSPATVAISSPRNDPEATFSDRLEESELRGRVQPLKKGKGRARSPQPSPKLSETERSLPERTPQQLDRFESESTSNGLLIFTIPISVHCFF